MDKNKFMNENMEKQTIKLRRRIFEQLNQGVDLDKLIAVADLLDVKVQEILREYSYGTDSDPNSTVWTIKFTRFQDIIAEKLVCGTTYSDFW